MTVVTASELWSRNAGAVELPRAEYALAMAEAHFWETVIRLDFAPGIRRERAVIAAAFGTLRRLEDQSEDEDAAIAAVIDVARQYGLVARVGARSRQAIEISITNR